MTRGRIVSMKVTYTLMWVLTSIHTSVVDARCEAAVSTSLLQQSSLMKGDGAAVDPPLPAPHKVAPEPLQGISAVVINLASRTDRWQAVSGNLSERAPWLPVDRFDAINVTVAPPSTQMVTELWSTARLAERFEYVTATINMTAGERGCAASHAEVWKMIAKGQRPVMVLEDDAVAPATFTSTLTTAMKEAPKGTGAIFLSDLDRGEPRQVGKVLMKPDFVWTTTGYILWPSAAQKLLSMLPVDMPVDNFMGYHISKGVIQAFSVKPAALRQAETWGVRSNVPHSDEGLHP
eukprot:TRINITY_DN6723_c0_g1_i2.p1 TRINITY_DN6723_c0_g1~~TRINITY_DN6723_c0_g1_i2.p1  ORF type:complete len:291 (+),score=20.69 TRINITY_DN6723_c0_g1_i2:68-940(+)